MSAVRVFRKNCSNKILVQYSFFFSYIFIYMHNAAECRLSSLHKQHHKWCTMHTRWCRRRIFIKTFFFSLLLFLLMLLELCCTRAMSAHENKKGKKFHCHKLQLHFQNSGTQPMHTSICIFAVAAMLGVFSLVAVLRESTQAVHVVIWRRRA